MKDDPHLAGIAMAREHLAAPDSMPADSRTTAITELDRLATAVRGQKHCGRRRSMWDGNCPDAGMYVEEGDKRECEALELCWPANKCCWGGLKLIKTPLCPLVVESKTGEPS